MFERFTDRAKQAVTFAQDEAITLGHDFIGTEHLLLGLARNTDGIARDVLGAHGVTPDRARDETVRLLTEAGVDTSGGQPATEALAAIGIDVDEIRRRADEAFGPGKFRFPRPPFTARAKRSLEYTLREAVTLGNERIGPEHLMLGVLHDDESVGLRVLVALGADPTELRSAVLARVTPD
ncbi:MAG TPA: Clp protease N-terminal domain-containing protein [Pseudonocardiaceae bacterium]|nr:Clp protease N-terminal domain-containing protein [Pseudonocardiaceae bacterium]